MNQLQTPFRRTVRREAISPTSPGPSTPATAAPPQRGHSFAAISVLPPADLGMQRDDDPQAPVAAVPDPLPPTSFTLPPPPTAPVNAADLPSGPGVGDFGPLPGTAPPDTAMAKFDDALVQRDDDPPTPPTLGTDVQLTYPFQLQVSTVYRGFDVAHLQDFLGTLDILHEPSASVSFSSDPGAGPVEQFAIGLVNQHINVHGHDVQAQISASLSGSLGTPGLPQPGVGGQLEIPITGPYSVVFNYGGIYTPPAANQPGKIDWSGGGGMLAHF